MDLDAFVEKQLELLELERNEEVEQNAKAQEIFTLKELENKGLCITRVSLDSCYTGLYGRRIGKFRAWKRGAALPANKFSSGDIAGVVLASDPAREIVCSGVVTNVGHAIISIAFDGGGGDSLPADDGRPFHLFKLANDVTYRRLKKTLDKLRKDREVRFSPLVGLLFGDRRPSDPLPTSSPAEKTWKFFNEQLDDSQQDAVKFALKQRELCIIHGPPGTGKTTTVVEIILQLVHCGCKVLACAPSNIAVDNLVERLVAHKGAVKLVRLGHPARALPEVQRHSLDAILARLDDSAIMDDIRRELDALQQSSAKKGKVKDARRDTGSRRRELQKELRQREWKAIEQTLRRADVVLSTLPTASDEGPLKCLPRDYFNAAVVDECSQALETACWMALLRAPKCILAGDHLQLPPTIVSKRAAEEGLSVTLMERLLKLHGDAIKKMLSVQYRMHAQIMQWPSDKLYDGKLAAHDTVAQHLLKDLPGVEDNEVTSIPLLLIDTAGCDMLELNTADEDSKGNEGEADLVSLHVERLISSGVKAADIAVISPYNLQVELLRLRMAHKHDGLEIRSVDGFQGREKEAVVMSFVRSNTDGVVGFLAEDRRINVAITRARRHLAVVCDGATISKHPFMKSLVDYLSTSGNVHSAGEYSADLDCCQPVRPAHLKLVGTNKSRAKKDGPRVKGPKIQTAAAAAAPSPGHDGKKQPKAVLGVRTGHRKSGAEARIEEVIRGFAASSGQEYVFPSTLNSYERRLVHEAAELLGLLHVSEGDGAERRIVLRKASEGSTSCTEKTLATDEHIAEKLEVDYGNASGRGIGSRTVSDLEDFKDMAGAAAGDDAISECDEKNVDGQSAFKNETICNKAKKTATIAAPGGSNKQTGELGASSEDECLGSEKPEADEKEAKKTVPRKGKKKQTKQGVAIHGDDEDNLDALIAEVVAADRTCAQPHCGQSTRVALAGRGGPCPLCGRGFCFSHALPEVHGCGEAAKAHARAAWKKSGGGSHGPAKPLKGDKREQVKKALEKKLEVLAEKRKPKAKND